MQLSCAVSEQRSKLICFYGSGWKRRTNHTGSVRERTGPVVSSSPTEQGGFCEWFRSPGCEFGLASGAALGPGTGRGREQMAAPGLGQLPAPEPREPRFPGTCHSGEKRTQRRSQAGSGDVTGSSDVWLLPPPLRAAIGHAPGAPAAAAALPRQPRALDYTQPGHRPRRDWDGARQLRTALSEGVLLGARRGECRCGRVHCSTRGQRVGAARRLRERSVCACSGSDRGVRHGIRSQKGCEEHLRLFLASEVLGWFYSCWCYRLCLVG